MESNLLLEQYSWYKKQQLAKAPFECLLNADIEPNPHQVNAFCAAIQALKTGGIILADEVGLGKTIEAGLVLNYVLDNGAKKVLISLPATLRKQWEVELLEKFGRQAVILDRYTVEHDLANVQTHLGNADEVSIVIASYDYSSKLIKRFPHRFKFAEVRQEVIEMLKKDLLGPSSENEILNQNPRFEYIVGMLAPQTSENDSNEQEIDGDASFEGDADYTAGEDDDNEPVFTNRFKTPSSIGISFYLESSTKSFNVDVTWGDYTKASDKTTNKEGKEVDVSTYKRHPQKETVVIDLQEFSKNKEYPLVCDSNVILYVSKIGLKQGYTLITAYVNNKRKNPESDIAGMMFQVNLRAYSQDKMDIFVAEHICRKILAVDEFYFAQRPILGRGRGCAATWKANKNGRASEIVSTFIPEYEFPGVSAALEGFDPFFFSMRTLSVAKKKDDIINRLNVLANSYEDWIQKKLIHDSKMDDAKFKKEIGDTVINKCIEALGRIRAGIQLLVEDDTAFDAFCFMNRSMILQRNIMNFSKKHGAGIECAFRDFVDPRDPSNNFGWRPFQIAFILINLKGIVDPEHDNREVVDLLYFPTGGGKTEAYLGLMAFVIANRRLRAEENDEYNRDGGVTAILRYTLRLLTTQQRDRITKMILAAELIRQKEYPKYGKEPISIGFWVGGTVTPNTFKELEEAPEDPAKTRIARSKKNSIYKQLLTCPFCGKPLTEENFYIDIPTKSVSIYCSDDKCMFYRYKPSNKIKIPVYLVDEEIYAKCPTIILSTVDKFARLPWDVNTNALFGRVDRICSRDGYVAIGADHARHNRTEELPTSTLRSIKPFLPPELIIQDELHLITGPLGTVYGAYETVIEDLCSYTIGEKKIKPKYVVSTATIKNAAEQTKCLYGRKVTAQFPPNGFEIGDSFYIREVPVEQDPFRRYVGVCAPGQSVKTALLRVYSIILQSAYSLEKFVAFENKSKLTNAKKLLKAKNSPVLQMKKNDLLENLKKHSRYKTMFKFEEDHIVISSQKEAAAFIKMLNDDIVRSELTGKEYDSSSKMLLGPVGASH